MKRIKRLARRILDGPPPIKGTQWCSCFENRDRYGVHCLLEPTNKGRRTGKKLTCQGNGRKVP